MNDKMKMIGGPLVLGAWGAIAIVDVVYADNKVIPGIMLGLWGAVMMGGSAIAIQSGVEACMRRQHSGSFFTSDSPSTRILDETEVYKTFD